MYTLTSVLRFLHFFVFFPSRLYLWQRSDTCQTWRTGLLVLPCRLVLLPHFRRRRVTRLFHFKVTHVHVHVHVQRETRSLHMSDTLQREDREPIRQTELWSFISPHWFSIVGPIQGGSNYHWPGCYCCSFLLSWGRGLIYAVQTYVMCITYFFAWLWNQRYLRLLHNQQYGCAFEQTQPPLVALGHPRPPPDVYFVYGCQKLGGSKTPDNLWWEEWRQQTRKTCSAKLFQSSRLWWRSSPQPLIYFLELFVLYFLIFFFPTVTWPESMRWMVPERTQWDACRGAATGRSRTTIRCTSGGVIRWDILPAQVNLQLGKFVSFLVFCSSYRIKPSDPQEMAFWVFFFFFKSSVIDPTQII